MSSLLMAAGNQAQAAGGGESDPANLSQYNRIFTTNQIYANYTDLVRGKLLAPNYDVFVSSGMGFGRSIRGWVLPNPFDISWIDSNNWTWELPSYFNDMLVDWCLSDDGTKLIFFTDNNIEFWELNTPFDFTNAVYKTSIYAGYADVTWTHVRNDGQWFLLDPIGNPSPTLYWGIWQSSINGSRSWNEIGPYGHNKYHYAMAEGSSEEFLVELTYNNNQGDQSILYSYYNSGFEQLKSSSPNSVSDFAGSLTLQPDNYGKLNITSGIDPGSQEEFSIVIIYNRSTDRFEYWAGPSLVSLGGGGGGNSAPLFIVYWQNSYSTGSTELDMFFADPNGDGSAAQAYKDAAIAYNGPGFVLEADLYEGSFNNRVRIEFDPNYYNPNNWNVNSNMTGGPAEFYNYDSGPWSSCYTNGNPVYVFNYQILGPATGQPATLTQL